MIIVGGTYREICARPNDQRLRGSGLRAAIALRDVAPDARLYTAVSTEDQNEVAAVAAAFGLLNVVPVPRTAPVTFSYYTPLSPPAIDGVTARLQGPIEATGDTALYFGLIEEGQDVTIRCQTLVLDPQGETGSLPLEKMSYERLAIVANEREVRRLTTIEDSTVAAQTLRDTFGADAVVVKCGARGSMVIRREGRTLVGPCPTSVVRPIGSGDVFSAAFAHAYGQLGADGVEAARAASNYTAQYVSTANEPPIGTPGLDSSVPFGAPVAVYLAGPFFGLGQAWLVDLVHRALRETGATPFSPFHDVGVGGPEVAKADLDGLDASTSVLALVDDFDAGTIFEIGYAVRCGKPVVAYLDPRRNEHLTMLEGTGVEVTDDLATAVYRAIWRGMAVE
jgi:nucleoside 2-deoxyribosyltransferase